VVGFQICIYTLNQKQVASAVLLPILGRHLFSILENKDSTATLSLLLVKEKCSLECLLSRTTWKKFKELKIALRPTQYSQSYRNSELLLSIEFKTYRTMPSARCQGSLCIFCSSLSFTWGIYTLNFFLHANKSCK
jgi:hypothetical protein